MRDRRFSPPLETTKGHFSPLRRVNAEYRLICTTTPPSLGGGTAIVYAFAKWLGGVWANRILENERASAAREHELLIRRRNVYAKLAISLRVFPRPHEHNPRDNREKFLEAYDEAALWAPDEIMNAIGIFLDMNRQNTSTPGSAKTEGLQAAYADCIVAMRKDCGFPQTEFKYRVVSF